MDCAVGGNGGHECLSALLATVRATAWAFLSSTGAVVEWVGYCSTFRHSDYSNPCVGGQLPIGLVASLWLSELLSVWG